MPNTDIPFEEEFKRNAARAITGDELMRRVSKRIYEMFDNDSYIPAGDGAILAGTH